MCRAILLACALAAAGCASSNGDSARMSTPALTAPQLAAYAASHPFPANANVTDQLKVAAIVNRGNSTIKIYNFDPKPIRDAEVWINKAYVQRVSGIAPNSSALIRFDELYNGIGQNFANPTGPVSTVHVRMEGNIYSILGPAAE
jgi:hypothetical protein